MTAYGLTRFMRMYSIHCGSWLAGDDGLTADLVFLGVHIHCCGNGHLGFRPYGEALFSNAKKVPKKARPQAYGTSLKLGVPSLRYSSGGIAYGLLRDDLLSMCAASPHGASRLPPR